MRVAVTGGGLAGAAIINALFREPHLDVHKFESASEFSERGQAIGLAINAQRALARLLPDAEDRPAGLEHVNLVSYDKVSSKLGKKLFEEDRQYGWIGEGGLFMHDVLNDGQMVQCVGTSIDRNPSSERGRSIDRQYLENAFSEWLNGPVAGDMIDLLLDQENPAVFAQREHHDAAYYVKDNICIACDAAHGMTPWQGSGAAMALEDVVVLGALFTQRHSRSQIAGALRAYDAIRRPRTQQIAALAGSPAA
ncbi:MAG: hypothetical protein Q9160_004055 [Pyrenula sp. 1 TL-2023]